MQFIIKDLAITESENRPLQVFVCLSLIIYYIDDVLKKLFLSVYKDVQFAVGKRLKNRFFFASPVLLTFKALYLYMDISQPLLD